MLWVSDRTPGHAARKCPSMSSAFPRNTTGEGNPGAYSNDPDSTTCNMPCSASSSHTTVWAAPQMSSLRSSSACLDDLHAGRCCGGATLAYPIPVRHPKFHHGGGIGSSLCGSFSTIDPARYGIDWPRSSLWAGKEILRDENIVVSRSYPAVTAFLVSTLPSSERLQPKPHPPSNKSLALK